MCLRTAIRDNDFDAIKALLEQERVIDYVRSDGSFANSFFTQIESLQLPSKQTEAADATQVEEIKGLLAEKEIEEGNIEKFIKCFN